MYDLGLHIQAKVNDIIEEGQWNWLMTNSKESIEVKANIATNFLCMMRR